MPKTESANQGTDLRRFVTACRRTMDSNFGPDCCVQATYLLAESAAMIKLPMQRVACKTMVFSPPLAKRIGAGECPSSCAESPRAGEWAVGIGVRSELNVPDPTKWNGHAVCVATVGGRHVLIDPSISQANRDRYGIALPCPLFTDLDADDCALFLAENGTVAKYWIDRSLDVPEPGRKKLLDRMARGFAKNWMVRALPRAQTSKSQGVLNHEKPDVQTYGQTIYG